MAHSKSRSASREGGSLNYTLIKVMTGSAIGTAAFFVLLAAAAAGILKSGIHQSMLPFIALGVAGIAAFLSGFAAVRPLRKKGIAYGTFSVVPMAAVILIVLTILNKGGLGLITLLMIPIMLVLGAAGGITATNMRKHRR